MQKHSQKKKICDSEPVVLFHPCRRYRPLHAVRDDVRQGISIETTYALFKECFPSIILVHQSSDPKTSDRFQSDSFCRRHEVRGIDGCSGAGRRIVGIWSTARYAARPGLVTISNYGIVATSPDPALGSTLSILDGQPQSAPILSTGNPNDASVLVSSAGNDLIGLHSSTDQLITGQFQPSQFLTGQLTAYKIPQPAIDQLATNQPANDQTISADGNTVQIFSDTVRTADRELGEYLDVPPISEPSLVVTPYIKSSFSSIRAARCFFGIYGVSNNQMNFQMKKCGGSNDLPNLPQMMSTLTPCLGVLKASEEGQILSILYNEHKSENFDLLQDSRGDFEAELHQATKFKVIRKDAHDRATLLTALGVESAE